MNRDDEGELNKQNVALTEKGNRARRRFDEAHKHRSGDRAGHRAEASPYPDVCRACSEAWRWKSSAQPDDGEGLVARVIQIGDRVV